MPTPLVPCAHCRRHIRIDHDACPFCAAVVPVDFARRVVPAAPRAGLDRIAIFTFAATLGVAGCLGDTTAVPMYGLPGDAGEVDAARDGGRSDASTSDGATTDARVDDDGGAVAMYGLPPPLDAGSDADDGGGVQALYGLPPDPDAG